MAGLLQQGMQPAPEQAPQGQPMQGQPPQQPPQGGQPAQEGNDPRVNATPEEAGPQFEALLEGMLGYLYGDGMQQATQMLQQGDDITRRMGQVIGTVMVTTFNMITQDGKTVPPNVMVRAGIELAKAVGEMAMEVGRLQPGEDEAIEAAFMLGLGLFGKTAEGLEDAQRQRYSEMVTAIQDGKRETMQEQQPPQQQSQGQPPQQPMMEGA